MGCATENCGRADCPVCSVGERFGGEAAPNLTGLEADGLRATSPALNGTKPRPSRDPRFIKRPRVGPTR